MKRIKWISLLLLCFIGLTATASDTIKVLAIGNSFSEDAAEMYLVGMATAGGHKMMVGNAVIGGATLEAHSNNANADSPVYSYRKVNVNNVKTTTADVTLLSIIKDEDWDYITFQQASPLSGLYDTYFPHLSNLHNYVKLHAVNPNVQYAIHMTWAYATNSTHDGFNNYGRSQLTMYNAIVDAVSRAANETDIEIVIPAGTAIQNGRTSIIGDNFCRDGYHLNTVGRFTAAYSWYEKILGESAIGNSFTHSSVSTAQREIAQQAAHYAISNPYTISELQASQSSVTLQDFENISVVLDQSGSDGTFFNWNAGFAPVELADNPLRSGINMSAKVAKVAVTGSNSDPASGSTGSGIIRISFSSTIKPAHIYPDHPDALQSGTLYYDRLRFKYYSNGVSPKYIGFEPNGSNQVIYSISGAYDTEWVHVDLPLTDPYYNTFQIRLNRGESGGTGSGTTAGDVVYVDDFELYNSETGSGNTFAKLTKYIDADFSCVNLGNGAFLFKTLLNETTHVKIDLISMDGHSQTFYNQHVMGDLEIPFQTSGAGLYLVRLTVDGVQSAGNKIVSQ